MTKTLQPKDPPCSLFIKGSIIESGAPKSSDRYIVLCPMFFETTLKEKLVFVDCVLLREENLTYKNSPEDVWACYLLNEKLEFTADLWKSKNTGELLVYVKSQGRLFATDDIIVAASILQDIKLTEAQKIVPQSAA